ncbi:polysaccharide deacetylase family protein [Polycladomyces subterraneus]|uniref:Polysaccharide deacetylase family protein n=1 Tax=Polycladomyces subterraneus TaxID=1016997 RepID=A0ABT8IM87_9BACL|nr:polysaccharide deacetylase family protein [Polycladomyces subterraneus]MDN4593898.1 polysaccharide deacetylase family protein [Polycladomyces subterraneus]
MRLWTRFVLVGLMVMLSAGCSGQVTAKPAPHSNTNHQQPNTAQHQASVSDTNPQSKQPSSSITEKPTGELPDEEPLTDQAQTDSKKSSTQLSEQKSSAESEPLIFFKGSGGKKAVALTFDDGPDTYYTNQVLNILKKEGVHATFFVTGKNAQAHPEMIRRILQEGHVLGNHSWNHPDLTRLTPSQAVEQIERTNTVIFKLTGLRMLLFRPPYGKLNDQLEQRFHQLGYTIVDWSVDTRDWAGTPAAKIMRYVRNQTGPGGIILQHSAGARGHLDNTIKALPRIIQYLKSHGYEIVTVPELLDKPAYAGIR